jgi:hypothetical protein
VRSGDISIQVAAAKAAAVLGNADQEHWQNTRNQP